MISHAFFFFHRFTDHTWDFFAYDFVRDMLIIPSSEPIVSRSSKKSMVLPPPPPPPCSSSSKSIPDSAAYRDDEKKNAGIPILGSQTMCTVVDELD